MPEQLAAGVIDLPVSIRARHCWRAMHKCCCFIKSCCSFNPRPPLLAGDATLGIVFGLTFIGFNPRPPLLAGDAAPRHDQPLWRKVSIRARHCWRAMLDISARRNALQWFQSAPAIAGGRCAYRNHSTLSTASFNPRPPLLAGDAKLTAMGLI